MQRPWRSSPRSAPLTYSLCPFCSPIKPPTLAVTSTRPEWRLFMSGRKACSIRIVPTTFTSSTAPTASSSCASSGPNRPRPALHTAGREDRHRCSCMALSHLQLALPCSLNSGLPGLVGHWVVKPITCISGRLTQHVHTTLSHTSLGSGHRFCIPDIQFQRLQGARRASSSPGCLQQWSLSLQVSQCGIY